MKLKVELYDEGISKFIEIIGKNEDDCLEKVRREYPSDNVDYNIIVDYKVVE